MKKYLLIILLLLCNNSAVAATYKKKIGDKYLIITSPKKETVGKNIHFESYSSKNSDVRLQYGETVIKANSATLETTKNKIYLKGGFYSKYLNNTISGTSLVYNPISNFFDADNVLVRTDKMITEAENFSYYGKKITLRKAHFGIDIIKLDLEFEKLDLYPGWVVADNTYLKVFKFPIIYAPKMVIDNRRNAFQLKPPIPEIGKSYFGGNYWESGIHYYLNDSFYGALRAGNAENKGWMFSSKHIFRFSDYDQFTISNRSWTWDRTEEIYSYEHSFMELPFKKKKYLDFSELMEYNLNIKDLPANSIRFTKTNYEEINESIINRDPQIIYTGTFDLPWYNLHLYTKDSYQYIEELVTSNVKAYKIQLRNELTRDFSLKYIGPFAIGIGYNNINYSKKPLGWTRLFNFITVKRSFWIIGSKVKATDYLKEQGGSPFIFDKIYSISDNIDADINIELLKNWILGNRTIYHTVTWKIHDNIYYTDIKRGSWTANIAYSNIRETGTISVSIDIL